MLRVDRFGNLITNIDRQTFETLAAAGPLDDPRRRASGVAGSSRPTPTRAPGELCALFGSTDHLEIAANGGERRRARSAAAAARRVHVASRPRDSDALPLLPPMINFDLTDEQRLLEQSVREWGAREVAPHIREPDRQHRFDRERVLGGMAKLGLLGISVPQEYGGAGMDYICLGLASEELEYVDTSLRVIMSVHAGLNCLSLLTWGTEDQKQRYLVPQAQGKKIAGYGLTEPAAGSDARGDPDDGRQEGRPLRAERREDVDLARRRRRQLPGLRLDRSRRRRSSAIPPA